MLDSGTRVVWALELFAESASSSGIAEAGCPILARLFAQGWDSTVAALSGFSRATSAVPQLPQNQ